MVQIALRSYVIDIQKMKAFGCILLLGLLCLSQAMWTPAHEISGDASAQIAAGVKAQLLANLDKITNKQAAESIRNDLNTDDDSKRTLKQIDTTTATQLFSIFGLKDANCDKNTDGKINGDELNCLSKIWKNYVPK